MSDENRTKIDALGYMFLAMANTAEAARLQGLISAAHCDRIKRAIWSQEPVAALEALPAPTLSVASVASGVEAQ